MASDCCCINLYLFRPYYLEESKYSSKIHNNSNAPRQEILIKRDSPIEIAVKNLAGEGADTASTPGSQTHMPFFARTGDTRTTSAAVATSLDNFSSTLEAPLNSIIKSLSSFSEDRETLDDDCRNSLNLALEAIDIIKTLITNRSDFSKLEDSCLELTCSAFTIRDLIQKTIKIMSHKSGDRNLMLTYNVAKSVPLSLIGDEGRLRQILLNLIGNAIKFTEKGGIEVNVSTMPTENNSITLRFEITDSGNGMTAKEMAKLFKPYSQANSSIAHEYGGTGLGLYLSMRLCELMSGEIGATSQLGEGSTFWFTAEFNKAQAIERNIEAVHTKRLMRHATDIAAQFAHEIRNPLGAAIYSLQYVHAHASLSPANKTYIRTALTGTEAMLDSLNGKLDTEKDKHTERENVDAKTKLTIPTKARILVVDDSLIQQKLMCKMLGELGFKYITVAGDGEKALALAEKSLFDIIFMDKHMDDKMDGTMTAKAIRALSKQHELIPIVSLSGDKIDEKPPLFNEYRQKPITKEDLLLTFTSLVGEETQAEFQ